MKYAIIGGTGVYSIGEGKEIEVDTDYGKVRLDEVDGIYFISRHGKGHTVPPHKINYRANIMALKKLGVESIYATAAVGSLNKDFEPGSFVIIDDFIDFTKARTYTFFDDEAKHLEMSQPYSKEMNEALLDFGPGMGVDFKGKGVYGATEGPRFESPAEIRFMQMAGVDLAGMTGVPEVNLAKEMAMSYSSVAIVVNWATGLAGPVEDEVIQRTMKGKKEKLIEVFVKIFKSSRLDDLHLDDPFI